MPDEIGLTGDIRDLARRLRVSPVTVYRWVREGMPCHALDGGLIRFSLAAAIDWLRSRKERPGPRAPGWISDDLLLAVLRAACDGEIGFSEAAEMVERFHASEWGRFVSHGGRLSNIREIAPLLPGPAAALVHEIADDYAEFTRAHVRLRETWSGCENFELPPDRTGLWELLEEIYERCAGIEEKLRSLVAGRDASTG